MIWSWWFLWALLTSGVFSSRSEVAPDTLKLVGRIVYQVTYDLVRGAFMIFFLYCVVRAFQDIGVLT